MVLQTSTHQGLALTVLGLWGKALCWKAPKLAHGSHTILTPLCSGICSNDASWPCRSCMFSCKASLRLPKDQSANGILLCMVDEQLWAA